MLLQNNAFGSNWLRPSQILIGRLFKLGLSVDFQEPGAGGAYSPFARAPLRLFARP